MEAVSITTSAAPTAVSERDAYDPRLATEALNLDEYVEIRPMNDWMREASAQPERAYEDGKPRVWYKYENGLLFHYERDPLGITRSRADVARFGKFVKME